MEINDKLLEKLSQLSALYLDAKEKAEMKGYLKETLSHFEKIRQIDTKNTPALVSPFNPPLATREDKVIEFPNKEELLNQAPEKEGSLVKAPQTLS